MRTASIIFAFALASTPALAQPSIEVPVTITAAPMTAPLCFFFFCGLGAVPDGAGGVVPFTNSRVMPDGSLRPYDPAIDGMPPDGPAVAAGPFLFAPSPMPEPPTVYYDPPPPVYHAPRRRSPQTPWQWHDPNPSPETLPDTREWQEPQ